MAMCSSKIQPRDSTFINDLKHIYTECQPGFEKDFWQQGVKPLIQKFEAGRGNQYDINSLLGRIRRFQGVYGRIKIIYKILYDWQDARKQPNPESIIHDADRFFNGFLIADLKMYGARKKSEINFCEKVKAAIETINSEKTLKSKISAADMVVRQFRIRKLVSFRKDAAIRKLDEFIMIYERYL